MTLIINPGSKVDDNGPPNTYGQACRYAQQWADTIRADFPDVQLIEDATDPNPTEGRWTFTFEHGITGVRCTLEHHGVTPEDLEQYPFGLRVYWNGSSSWDPDPLDWLPGGRNQSEGKTTGWRMRVVYEPTDEPFEVPAWCWR